MKLAALFSDHAVLQREITIPVWGWTHPHHHVKVELASCLAQYPAAADGKFVIRLPAMPAGGPYELTVTDLDTNERIVVYDVWVGEVWLASGQSNMEWTLKQIEQHNQPPVPELRMINIPRNAFAGRQSDTIASWLTADSSDIVGFSAVAYFFGRDLQAKLGVHVGMINSSWGGTIIEAWTSRETLSRNPDMIGRLADYEDFIAKLGTSEPPVVPPYVADPGNHAVKCGWADPEFNDHEWDIARFPATWTSLGHKYSGVFWFRRTIELSAEWCSQDLLLEIGAVDKQDITYFNGEPVGATGKDFEESFWNVPRRYHVPGRLVKAGRNTIAVHAYSFVYDGGLIGPVNAMKISRLAAPATGLPLDGYWFYKEEYNFGRITPILPPPGPGNSNSPYMLFDNMIAPLLPYGIRGAIWYQGESNTNNATQYLRMFTDMIRDWRYSWGQGDFPFLFVQLANYINNLSENWALLRDAQSQALAEPNTGMAVAIDIGNPDDLHPVNKQEIGRRLALLAQQIAYNQTLVASGPRYRGMTITGNATRLWFDCSGSSLVARYGQLRGFEVAGTDRVFEPAHAKIDGDSIVVSCPQIAHPIAVRYGWAGNPQCDLYNKAGLPASPFRTDSWHI